MSAVDATVRADKRLMAYSAAAILRRREALPGPCSIRFIPGGPSRSAFCPGFATLSQVVAIPRPLRPEVAGAVFPALGPVGVVLIGVALADGPEPPATAPLLYLWPVLWDVVLLRPPRGQSRSSSCIGVCP